MDGFTQTLIAFLTVVSPLYLILIQHEKRLTKIEAKVDLLLRFVNKKNNVDNNN